MSGQVGSFLANTLKVNIGKWGAFIIVFILLGVETVRLFKKQIEKKQWKVSFGRLFRGGSVDDTANFEKTNKEGASLGVKLQEEGRSAVNKENDSVKVKDDHNQSTTIASTTFETPNEIEENKKLNQHPFRLSKYKPSFEVNLAKFGGRISTLSIEKQASIIHQNRFETKGVHTDSFEKNLSANERNKVENGSFALEKMKRFYGLARGTKRLLRITGSERSDTQRLDIMKNTRKEISFHGMRRNIVEGDEHSFGQKGDMRKAVESISTDIKKGVLNLLGKYVRPSVKMNILDNVDFESLQMTKEQQSAINENKRKLLEKLRIYNIEVVRTEETVGPPQVAPHVKVSKIVALQDDLAMAMAARGIRILAPIPGKNAVGIEIPNPVSKIVKIKTVLEAEKFQNTKFELPVVLGKTIGNEVYVDDLTKMPHLLVAGATGSGKSVGINTIIASLLFHCKPSDVKLMLIDPKRVELFPYDKLKLHFLVRYKELEEQIITDTSKAVYALKSIEKEMDERYIRLEEKRVRNIQSYNEKFKYERMPYIVVVIDELADMMLTAGREVEEPIARLAQLARAVGIHLVVATQRPSVNVITGVIKANFPARIAYQVASNIDSRTILDTTGADQLLGNGDLLYLSPAQAKPVRIQNAYISTDEVERVTEYISKQPEHDVYELPYPDIRNMGSNAGKSDFAFAEDRDEMFREAACLVIKHQQGSVSLLQRRLKLGFGRAARIMDQLEKSGIVGPPDGSKPREVLVSSESELDTLV
ncbi:hypothetical protein CHS0354_024145 [Potamilus streckersoni]|uniref:FtsK domain-containing protein n=1 Tax=Potamilus streckersoni TaxID=2493646 RepID=A0AAE0RZI6_9BIVA|nr:hypothetical protein CHS0354_024145 [Potamilus streckersoni]